MYFELSEEINRSPDVVFTFLRDIEKHPLGEGSRVTLLDKITPGPTGVGTRYREVVQMGLFGRLKIFSEITAIEADKRLEMDFDSGSMFGHLAYYFEGTDRGTRLTQRETLNVRGATRLFSPIIYLVFPLALRRRLKDIKEVLEQKPMD